MTLLTPPGTPFKTRSRRRKEADVSDSCPDVGCWNFFRRKLSFGLITAQVLLAAFASVAQTVRVTSWDMADAGATDKSSPAIIEQTAQQLKAVSPDVLFLRGVSGWKMCSQLAEALKPAEYRVLVCSAFHDPASAGLAPSQIAILARNSAYFTWSEPWNFEDKVGREVGSRPSVSSVPNEVGRAVPSAPPGGFCFAAVQVAGHRFGFSCLDLPKTQKRYEGQAARQWLETLSGYRGWAANRLEGFVSATFGLSGADTDTGRMLSDATFADPLKGNAPMPPGKALRTHLFPSADEPAGLVLSACPATCDFDFRPVPVVVVAAATSPPAATPSASRRSAALWWIGGASLFLVLITIIVMQIGIRRRLLRLQSQAALVPLGSGSYNVVMAGPVATSPALPALASPTRDAALRQSLHTHLAEWLKQTFVQRLLRDREHLRATQQVAALKVSSMDERLARVEARIQKETASYEKQIEQLSRELSTAREENLELIRTQIRLLKSEMDAARARVLESESVED